MYCMVSIFREKIQTRTSYNGRSYGYGDVQLIFKNMVNLAGNILLVGLALWVTPVSSETDYFPGLRRPPPMSNWAQTQPDESSYLLAQLNSIIEEQARRRFQQQLAQQQQRYYQHQFQHHRQPSAVDPNSLEPSFTFRFPENGETTDDGSIPFAVNPADPRYYDSSTKNSDKTNSYEDEPQARNTELNKPPDSEGNGAAMGDFGGRMNDDVPYYKLKPPMNVDPKLPSDNSVLQNTIAVRDDLNALVEKLQKTGQANAIFNGGQGQQRAEVVKKHMGMDGTMGMYVVALIAGVSAAVTVGLIALGIAWYTLHKKAKAAADVDYPAYGVTGPNKDISPSGDRRLAQSAQMYHYQHQKQQIIAMENRTNGEHQGGMSDVESDDDNEEGDYTVYECPGLAPTAEMEVKNPLFLDDTPVTPSTNYVEGQNSQQQQPQPQPTQSQQKPAKKQTKPSSDIPKQDNAKGFSKSDK